MSGGLFCFQTSLKAVLLHNGNGLTSIPEVYAMDDSKNLRR